MEPNDDLSLPRDELDPGTTRVLTAEGWEEAAYVDPDDSWQLLDAGSWVAPDGLARSWPLVGPEPPGKGPALRLPRPSPGRAPAIDGRTRRIMRTGAAASTAIGIPQRIGPLPGILHVAIEGSASPSESRAREPVLGGPPSLGSPTAFRRARGLRTSTS